jgi:2,4-dichlorophenol 6-monooxygenase
MTTPSTADRQPFDVDVAIVGAGPVGLTLAALLDREGFTSRVFERRASLHRDPQAHVVNTRTMEILRELGLERAVLAAAAPPMRMRAITWCENLAGREFGRFSLQGDSPAALVERLAASPTTICNLAQNLLEPMLHRLVRHAARCEVSFGSEVVSTEAEADGVRVGVREGDGRAFEVRARFVAACDGAGSRVRQALGIEMEGPASLQRFVTIYFEANLDRWIGGRPGPLYWIAGPHMRGVILGFDVARTWALMVPFDDPHTPADFEGEVAERLLRAAIGDSSTAFRISSVSNWNMSAQIAERYRSGRVFLVGDAAHRFPPSGGLGMNTGIQDAHNLAWKLAAVLRGEADAEILDTYERERRGVARINCDHSVLNAMRMFEIDAALGMSMMGPVNPTLVSGEIEDHGDYGLDGDGEAAVAKRRAVQDVIHAQADHFDFGGLDLGFRYDEGALVHDGSEALPLDVRLYTPTTRPGSRLPHAWLEGPTGRVSTLDVARPGRFTLLVGGDGEGWIDAVRALARRGLQRLDVAMIADSAEADYRDVDGTWQRVCGVDASGAVLVRPDGHVAWRSATATMQDAGSVLGDVIARVLGRGPTGEAVSR